MFKATIKGLLAHKMRLVTTMASVVLGVALMAGTLVLTDTVGRSFDDLYADIGRGTDTVVRSTTMVTSPRGADQRGPIDAAVLDAVRGAPGVRAAGGQVQGYAQFVGKDGKAIGNPGSGAPTYGLNWPEAGMPNAFDLVAGHAPQGADEVVMDKASADKGGYAVGDRVRVLTQQAPTELTVSGIVRFGTVDSPLGASIALFDLDTVQRLVGHPGQFDSITAVAEPGIGQDELTQSISQVLPPKTEAITGAAATAEQQSQVRKGLSFFNTFLLVFALVALFVGSFIIYNTFSIIVAQRTRELAMLRAIGAGRAQVRRAVLLEAVLVGAVASAIGVAGGVVMAAGLEALLGAFGFDIPTTGMVVTSTTVLVTLFTGLTITVVSAWLPARHAARIAPIAALRDIAVDRSAASRARFAIGTVLTGAGAAILAVGLFSGADNAVTFVGAGATATFLGIAVLGPVIVRPISAVIGTPIAWSRGVPGRLARSNASRNPKRTSSTAAALMIGVALVGFITIFAASAKTSINKTIDETFHTDFIIDSGAHGFGGLSPELVRSLRTHPELASVASVRMTFATVSGAPQMVLGVDPATASSVADLGRTTGSVDALGGSGVAVSEATAAAHGWHVGDHVAATFAGADRDLQVTAIYQNADLVGDFLVGFELYDQVVPQPLDSLVYVSLAPGTPAATGRAVIEQVSAAYPNAQLQDLTEFKAAQAKPIDQMLSLIYALLLLAVIIALLGIANTLALSIHERTRELGLLRAVGMSRSQTRSSIRWESVIIALFGTALGLGIGLCFGWAVVRSLADKGFNQLSVPAGQLAVVAVLAALAGVVAAVLPARRAARVDVLEAIATA